MTYLWCGFILLALAVVIGAWCLISTLFVGNYWRSMNDPTPTERRIACTGSVLLLALALGFALTALLKGG